jgi:hypothetical protein
MVDFVRSRLYKNKNEGPVDLKGIITELLESIISPDYNQTGKVVND